MSTISGLYLESEKYNITLPFLIDFTTTAGSNTSGAYLAAKWAVTDVNGITTPVNGMTIALRVPLAGNSGGVLLSIDGGTTYYPIVRNVSTLVTTHYGVGSTIILTFNSTQTAKPYLTAGTTTTVTGCWQVADYDSDTKVTQTVRTTNGEFPILLRGTSAGTSTTTTTTTFGTGVTVNPSTKTVTADNITAKKTFNLGRKSGSTSGNPSAAFGGEITASGQYSVGEGYGVFATGMGSHAEGNATTASDNYSHAEGFKTTASAQAAHAEGASTVASAMNAHAEGAGTIAASANQHVQGVCNVEDSAGVYAHIVGNGTSDTSRRNIHTLDWNGDAWFKGNVHVGGTAQGTNSDILVKSSDLSSYAPKASPALTGTPTAPTAAAGTNTTQIATTAFVTTAISNANDIFVATYGTTTIAEMQAAYAAGKTLFVKNVAGMVIPVMLAQFVLSGNATDYVCAVGTSSSVPGTRNPYINFYKWECLSNNSWVTTEWYAPSDENPIFTGSMSMGRKSGTTTGTSSVAVGEAVTASGARSNAEGYNTQATGINSHAEGNGTVASGTNSHAEGEGTIAAGLDQHVEGSFNIQDSGDNYLHIAGNGESSSARSNAHTLDWNGNAWFAGDVYVGGTNQTTGSSKLVKSSDLSSYAPKASPALTGTPTAPTAAAGTNTTQIATTAFVTTAVSNSNAIVTTEGTGSVYTATVPGITELKTGISFIMIPHVTSSTTTPSLNVNNLGSKPIRRNVNIIYLSQLSGKSNNWLQQGRPHRLIYDGSAWIVEGMEVASAKNLSGEVPIENGGTGATTAAEALTNLGITYGTTDLIAGTSSLAEGNFYFCYE